MFHLVTDPNKRRGLIQLTRLDKPIGVFLLLWPTLWALWIAADGWPTRHLLVVFALGCLLYTSPSPRDLSTSRMPSSA